MQRQEQPCQYAHILRGEIGQERHGSLTQRLQSYSGDTRASAPMCEDRSITLVLYTPRTVLVVYLLQVTNRTIASPLVASNGSQHQTPVRLIGRFCLSHGVYSSETVPRTALSFVSVFYRAIRMDPQIVDPALDLQKAVDAVRALRPRRSENLNYRERLR